MKQIPASNPKINLRTAASPSRATGIVVGAPQSVDWRTARGGMVTPIRDQGSCGSCWAFGTTGLYESLMMIGGGVGSIDLSEEFILECTTYATSVNNDCTGGNPTYSVPLALSWGIPLESVFPYLAYYYG
jgi:C1A family cysteine protease